MYILNKAYILVNVWQREIYPMLD